MNFAYIEFVQNKNFLQFLNSQRKTHFLQCRDWNWITKNFRNKLKTLMRNETFNEFQKSTKTIKWNFLIDFIAFKTTIKRYISRWFKIIEIISIDFKFSRNYYHIRERQFINFFTFCYYLYSRKFSNFQFIFAFYLYHDDTKHRVINFLYVLRFIISYKIFQNRLKKLTSDI